MYLRKILMIEEMGVQPFHILAITFTNKAAGENITRSCNIHLSPDCSPQGSIQSEIQTTRNHTLSPNAFYQKNFRLHSASGMQGNDRPAADTKNVQGMAGGWKCSCGAVGNTGKFCVECGMPKYLPIISSSLNGSPHSGQNFGGFFGSSGSHPHLSQRYKALFQMGQQGMGQSPMGAGNPPQPRPLFRQFLI